LCPTTSAFAQLPTIPELLASQGSSRRITGIPSGQAPTVDELLKQTDIVVRGTVGAPTTFLSDDQRDVYTEYSLSDVTVLHQRRPARPGILPPLTVVVRGGAITIDGRTFVQEDEAFPALAPGTTGVFLLTRTADRYRLAGWVFGAFAVTKNGLRPFTRKLGFGEELTDLSASQSEAHLVARARELNP
jgi:hypothetical protein